MTDETSRFTTEDKIDLLMTLYGYSEDEARKLALDSDTKLFDVEIDGEPYIGKSIFDTE